MIGSAGRRTPGRYVISQGERRLPSSALQRLPKVAAPPDLKRRGIFVVNYLQVSAPV